MQPRGPGSGSVDIIEVGGDLKGDLSEYDRPIVIHFTTFGSPRKTRPTRIATTPTGRRSPGLVVEQMLADKKWTGSVEAKEGKFEDRDARGIGVAILPNHEEFAYETLTWCSHIELKVTKGTSAA